MKTYQLVSKLEDKENTLKLNDLDTQFKDNTLIFNLKDKTLSLEDYQKFYMNSIDIFIKKLNAAKSMTVELCFQAAYLRNNLNIYSSIISGNPSYREIDC